MSHEFHPNERNNPITAQSPNIEQSNNPQAKARNPQSRNPKAETRNPAPWLVKLSLVEEEDYLQKRCRLYCDTMLELPNECPDNIRQLYAHLRQYVFTDCRIGEAREEHKLFDNNISRRFANWIGLKPKEFVQHHRLCLAELLLTETSCSIVGIALALGYRDQDAFGIAVKRKYGVCPTLFRQQAWAQMNQEP